MMAEQGTTRITQDHDAERNQTYLQVQVIDGELAVRVYADLSVQLSIEGAGHYLIPDVRAFRRSMEALFAEMDARYGVTP